jgi:pimeloyl-ACP methyl ester carboxylesterase
VEQVRLALRLDSSNFYLLGHSWGGVLAIEYPRSHGVKSTDSSAAISVHES